MPMNSRTCPPGRNGDARAERDGIAELKARVDLVDLARRYTKLKLRGRVWWACCPIHGERTPSLKIDPRRQTLRCFGCGTHGDVIDFVAAVEGLDTGGAIRRLRELVGGAPLDPQAEAVRAARAAAAEAQEAVEAANVKAAVDDISPAPSFSSTRASSACSPSMRCATASTGLPASMSERSAIIASSTSRRSGASTLSRPASTSSKPSR